MVSVRPPLAAAAQPPQDDVDVGEDDEGRRQDRTVVEGHDQLIPLELPHLVGDRLDLEEGVAVDEKRVEASLGDRGPGPPGLAAPAVPVTFFYVFKHHLILDSVHENTEFAKHLESDIFKTSDYCVHVCTRIWGDHTSHLSYMTRHKRTNSNARF